MDRKPGTTRAALSGTAAALCIAATLFTGACTARNTSFDFPAMRLTSAPADTVQAEQQ